MCLGLACLLVRGSTSNMAVWFMRLPREWDAAVQIYQELYSVAALSNAVCEWVSSDTGWPGVSTLFLCKVTRLVSSCYLRVATRRKVGTGSMVFGGQGWGQTCGTYVSRDSLWCSGAKVGTGLGN